jgi:hypothetical protein
LRNREVSRFAVDFGRALRNDFGTRPDVDAPQFRIGYRLWLGPTRRSVPDCR